METLTLSKRRLAWVFDLNKCIGCQTWGTRAGTMASANGMKDSEWVTAAMLQSKAALPTH